MKHLHLECLGGVSGDMLLSLLVDLGFSPGPLEKILGDILKDEIKIRFEEINYNFLKGKRLLHNKLFDKKIINNEKDLKKFLKNLNVEKKIKKELEKIYEKLIGEEKKIHKDENFHLHEIGCLDTLIDILGFLLGKEVLGISSFSVGALPLGKGYVKTSHGEISIPAPLTLAFLKNFYVVPEKGEGETITPTGALILSHFFESKREGIPMVFEKIGVGFGQRETKEKPNALKGYLGKIKIEKEEIVEMKVNFDDFTGQMAGNILEKLLENGAKDVVIYPVLMKKSRPGYVLEVLCYEKEFEKMKEIIFKESTTLGLRYRKMEREVLDKKVYKIKTPYGFFSLKTGWLCGKLTNVSFEYEELKKFSEKEKIPIKEFLWKLNPYLEKFIEDNLRTSIPPKEEK